MKQFKSGEAGEVATPSVLRWTPAMLVAWWQGLALGDTARIYDASSHFFDTMCEYRPAVISTSPNSDRSRHFGIDVSTVNGIRKQSTPHTRIVPRDFPGGEPGKPIWIEAKRIFEGREGFGECTPETLLVAVKCALADLESIADEIETDPDGSDQTPIAKVIREFRTVLAEATKPPPELPFTAA